MFEWCSFIARSTRAHRPIMQSDNLPHPHASRHRHALRTHHPSTRRRPVQGSRARWYRRIRSERTCADASPAPSSALSWRAEAGRRGRRDLVRLGLRRLLEVQLLYALIHEVLLRRGADLVIARIIDTIQKAIAVDPNSVSSAAGMSYCHLLTICVLRQGAVARARERDAHRILARRHPQPGGRDRETAEPAQGALDRIHRGTSRVSFCLVLFHRSAPRPLSR